MRIEIELRGPGNKRPSSKDIQKNIDALQRAIDGKPLSGDFQLNISTKSILEGIKRKL